MSIRPCFSHFLEAIVGINILCRHAHTSKISSLSLISKIPQKMDNLHVFLFPFMAQGHMIPFLDIAKLFSSRGVRSSIITTPLNAHFFTKAIPKIENSISGTKIDMLTIKFPKVDTGLPEDCENTDQIPTEDLMPRFILATTLLKDQVEQLLEEHNPSFIVADFFFPWATEIAAKFKIPRLVFNGTSLLSITASESMRLYKPQNNVLSDDEPFVLPNLPHEIKLTRTKIAPFERQVEEREPEPLIRKFLNAMRESVLTSYGSLVNSFQDLEPEYVVHCRGNLGIRIWCIGPVSLCNSEVEEKVKRGKSADIEGDECIKWLDSKKPNSVIYICFGSMVKLSIAQLHEIATAIESTGLNFIWVVKKGVNVQYEGWLPEGFEERERERGLIIRGWAPQMLILDHQAIGCFMTHCGWNSTLESIAAGVPMVTWPFFGDQFHNEILVTELLKIGAGVGALQMENRAEGVAVQREEIVKAIERVMVGIESKEMRNRVKGFKEMAKKAVEKGGSSYSDLDALIQELSVSPP